MYFLRDIFDDILQGWNVKREGMEVKKEDEKKRKGQIYGKGLRNKGGCG